MRRLVLVKHSLPEIEPDKPASAWRLGAVGRRRREALAVGLGDFSPEEIWSSREPKAVETADPVAGALGVPVRVADGLEEHHRDNVSLLPEDDFEEMVERLFCNPDQLVFGTETADQARDRMAAAIGRVINAGQADSIVVTHGTVIALFVASVADLRPVHLWRRLGLPSYVVLTVPSMAIHSVVQSVDGGKPPTELPKICRRF